LSFGAKPSADAASLDSVASSTLVADLRAEAIRELGAQHEPGRLRRHRRDRVERR
jgi:hypothetical protein